MASAVKPDVTGIYNPDIHCYMNSALQLLWSLPSFRAMIINLRHKDLKTLTSNIFDGKKYVVTKIDDTHIKQLTIIIKLFEDYAAAIERRIVFSKDKPQAPVQLDPATQKGINDETDPQVKALMKHTAAAAAAATAAGDVFKGLVGICPNLQITRQEDSQEFLNGVIDLFDNYSSNPIIKEFIDSIKITQTKLYTCLDETKPKIIQTGSNTPYKDENNIVREPLKMLNMPIHGTSIQSSIDAFIDNYEKTDKGQLTGYPKHEGCAAPGAAENNKIVIMQETQYTIPNMKSSDKVRYLLIQLKRFRGLNKINTSVALDKKITFTFNRGDEELETPVEFRLKGCIRHLGVTIRSGHYIYQTYKADGTILYVANDSNITYGGVEDPGSAEQGYIFLYERILTPENKQKQEEIDKKKKAQKDLDDKKNKKVKEIRDEIKRELASVISIPPSPSVPLRPSPLASAAPAPGAQDSHSLFLQKSSQIWSQSATRRGLQPKPVSLDSHLKPLPETDNLPPSQ